jgi:hypothetical protein
MLGGNTLELVRRIGAMHVLGEGRVWTAAAAAHEGVLPRERRASGSAQSAARRRGRRQVHVIRGRLRVHLACQVSNTAAYCTRIEITPR